MGKLALAALGRVDPVRLASLPPSARDDLLIRLLAGIWLGVPSLRAVARELEGVSWPLEGFLRRFLAVHRRACPRSGEGRGIRLAFWASAAFYPRRSLLPAGGLRGRRHAERWFRAFLLSPDRSPDGKRPSLWVEARRAFYREGPGRTLLKP